MAWCLVKKAQGQLYLYLGDALAEAERDSVGRRVPGLNYIGLEGMVGAGGYGAKSICTPPMLQNLEAHVNFLMFKVA